MKKNRYIKRVSLKKWAEAASFLSGERNHRDVITSDAAIDEEIIKKWNDLKMTDRERNIDVDNAWAKVSQRIDVAEEKKEETAGRFIIPIFYRVAATVLIVIGLGFAGYRIALPKQITVVTSSAEKNVNVSLPDGSIIWLNRNSSLIYPAKFRGNTRKVTLTGEAYFEIARNEAKPFIINAGKADVKVLGTTFNVITNNDKNQVEVFVTSGTVMVTSRNGENKVTLKPGDIGRISDSRESSEINKNANYLSWNTDRLVYNGETLEKVFTDLKRAYNIDIKTNDPQIKNYTLTTVFEDQPHDTIIKVICTTFNLKFKKDGESYLVIKR